VAGAGGGGRLIAGVCAVFLVVAGLSMVVAGASAEPAPRPSAVARHGAGPVATTAEARDAPAGNIPVPLRRSVPIYLAAPTIGVHTPVTQLGLNPDGTMAVPPLGRDAPAGWYRYLSTPGENGPAVIVGHVDSARDGPAVFFRLGALRPGDPVLVTRADGGTVTFRVTVVTEYSKTAFPTDTVYGPVGYPRLVLITCGGSFDRSRHGYSDSVVVFATVAPPDSGGAAPAGSTRS
jgi:Sortase domain